MIAGIPDIGPHDIIARIPNISDHTANGELVFMINFLSFNCITYVTEQ